MKQYFPYAPSSPTTIYGEEHVIENGQILLNHIPLADSIEIEGFRQTNSAVLVANQFYCAYGSEYYYREANCIVRFNELHNGETVRVKYQQVGTIITANDMNEIKEHLENSDLHSSFVLPAASAETRGGIRVGHGLSISDDVLSADAQNYTLPSATPLRLGGVVVESDENISRTIERYFPTAGETLPVHTQTIATRETLGSVKIGDGLSITEDGLLTADAQNFTLTPASRDSLGGVKVGSGLSIDVNGVLSADSVEPYMLPTATADSLGGVKVGSRLSIDTNGILSADALQSATTSRLGGVVVESDANIARTIERYFPSVTADTEILSVLSSIPVATADSLGGVKIGERLTITEDGILSADAQGFTLTAATSDSLGGIKVGNSLTITNGVLNYNLPNASTTVKGGVVYATDTDIANTIERYFPSVTADTEIIPALTSIPVATAESIGGVKIGSGLSITEDGLLSADAQNFTLTPATRDSLGGVKIGDGLSITGGGVLSALAQDFTLKPATNDSLGGVFVESDENISRTIQRYFPTVGADEIIPVLTSIPPATRESIGGVIVGDGLTISENGILSAEAQTFTLTPATHDSLGGVKVGDGLSITGGGVLTALAQDFTLTAATTSSLGGVMIESDENVASMIENYFPSDWTFAPALTSIPPATRDSLGGIKVGDRLSISADGILSADAQGYTLTPATTDSLGGVKIGTTLTFTNSVLDYNLPVASSTTRGGIKIGRGLTMSGESLNADAQNFTLTAATTDSLGGVKIVDDSEIAAMIEEYFPTVSGETIAPLYSIPAATYDSLGGIIPGVTMSIEDGVLDYYLPAASSTQFGGVKIGRGLTITDGLLSADAQDFTLTAATASSLGGVKIGNGLSITADGLLSANAQDFTLKPATSSQLGGIKVGSRLSITADGILSADSVAPYTLPAASDEEISSMIEEYFPESLTPEPYTLPAATKTSLGGIIVGDRLSISSSGVLSADVQSYTLPTASASTKGGIKIGKGLTMTGETLSADADNYTLPTASTSQLGGVRIGNTLTISNGTLNYNLPTASASQLGGVKVGNTLTISNGVLNVPVAGDEEISAIIENYFPASIEAGTVMGVQFVEDSDVNSMLATVFSGS